MKSLFNICESGGHVRCAMRWPMVLVIVLLLSAGCTSTAPTQTPSTTVDVGGTVDAAVEATRTAERAVEATVDASVEATRAAAPTSTPVVMTIYAPTPEPYVALPGRMEQGIQGNAQVYSGKRGVQGPIRIWYRAGRTESGGS